MLMEMRVKDFLAELASDSPAPGGGSVAALAGALACALVVMVARLSMNKGTAGREEMERVLGTATGLMESLSEHVDEDTEAFNRVMRAYRLPRGTDAEKGARREAIQDALQGAARHPLRVAGECLQVLRLCEEVVGGGNPNALSDAGVAALLAYAGVAGAGLNVAINLESITDPAFLGETGREKDAVTASAGRLYADIRDRLGQRLSGAW